MEVGNKEQGTVAKAGIGKREIDGDNIGVSDAAPILCNGSNGSFGRFVRQVEAYEWLLVVKSKRNISNIPCRRLKPYALPS